MLQDVLLISRLLAASTLYPKAYLVSRNFHIVGTLLAYLRRSITVVHAAILVTSTYAPFDISRFHKMPLE